MAHKHLSYLDIPAARRRATASKVVGRLKESLTNPALTEEQAVALREKIDHLNKWASGNVPTNHVVEVVEEVVVEEEM